jgi:hypothetical protein
MDFSSIITSKYERNARLYPALLLISPIIVVVGTSLSRSSGVIETIMPIIIGCGGAFLLVQLARDAGKKKEKELFNSMGGMPSVTIFRHRDNQLDAITKIRYHNKLAALLKDAKAPSMEEEENDPIAADAIYSAWSSFLRANTRDTKTFDLLFQENINYGYRRNVWGLRPIGISLTIAAIFGATVRIYTSYQVSTSFELPVFVAAGYCLFILALWVFRFNNKWVTIPAREYAKRLAESVEILAKKLPKK